MTILIISEDIKHFELLNNTFKTIDAANECLIVTDPEQGLALLNEELVKPELILTELLTSKMNGLQFYYAIKNNPKFQSIPVYITSAYLTNADIACFSQAGVKTLIKQHSNDHIILSLQSILGELSTENSDSILKRVNSSHADSYNMLINPLVDFQYPKRFISFLAFGIRMPKFLYNLFF